MAWIPVGDTELTVEFIIGVHVVVVGVLLITYIELYTYKTCIKTNINIDICTSSTNTFSHTSVA